MTAADGPSAPATGAQQSTAGATYNEKAPVAAAFNVGLQGAGVGLLVSSVQNSLQKHKAGAMGVVTRTGGTIGLFALMGASFTYVDHTLANIRQQDDAINGAGGGCAAGFLMGLRQGNLASAVAGCAVLGAVIGTYDLAGRSLSGDGRQYLPAEEREARRQAFFKKRPLSESISGSEAMQE